MGTAGNVGTDQRIFRMKDMGIDLFKRIPSVIIIAVTGGWLKTLSAHFIGLHGHDDFHLVIFCHRIDRFKPVLQTFYDSVAKIINFRQDSRVFIHFFHL